MMAYTVVAGDTLYGIADRFGVPRADVVAANPQIQNINVIVPGQVVYVPARGSSGVTPPGGTGMAASGASGTLAAIAMAGIAAVGLYFLFKTGAPARKNPSRKGKRGKLKKMSAGDYLRAAQNAGTAYRVGTALARRYR